MISFTSRIFMHFIEIDLLLQKGDNVKRIREEVRILIIFLFYWLLIYHLTDCHYMMFLLFVFTKKESIFSDSLYPSFNNIN